MRIKYLTQHINKTLRNSFLFGMFAILAVMTWSCKSQQSQDDSARRAELATEEKINAIAEAKANPLSESQAVTFTLTEGLNSIVAISYDRQDKRYVNVKEIYCMPVDAGN